MIKYRYVKKDVFIQCVKRAYEKCSDEYLITLRDALSVVIFERQKQGLYINYLLEERFLRGFVRYEIINKN